MGDGRISGGRIELAVRPQIGIGVFARPVNEVAVLPGVDQHDERGQSAVGFAVLQEAHEIDARQVLGRTAAGDLFDDVGAGGSFAAEVHHAREINIVAGGGRVLCAETRVGERRLAPVLRRVAGQVGEAEDIEATLDDDRLRRSSAA